MKILWHSNATWVNTGYGNQTKLYTRALADAGHEVTVSAYHGLAGGRLTDPAGILHLPRGVEQHGNDIIEGHIVATQADIVWSLIDLFALDLKTWSKFAWAGFGVIDSEPVRPQEILHFQAMRWPIAMSKFGAEQIKGVGRESLYIPHMIDTNIFKPISREFSRRTLEMITGRTIPDDAFVVTTVAANGTGWPSRKNFAGMLEAFSIFATTHPDALFYIHTEPKGIWKGDPLLDMAEQYGIADRVLFPKTYHILVGAFSDETMNELYNASDVFMNLSRGEGFGIPSVEAQAAGLPVILTNFSASRELCMTGWTVNGPLAQYTPMTKQMLPDPLEAAQRLNDAYGLWRSDTIKAGARRQALAYDLQAVTKNYLLPAVERIESELKRESQIAWLKRNDARLKEIMYLMQQHKM